METMELQRAKRLKELPSGSPEAGLRSGPPPQQLKLMEESKFDAQTDGNWYPTGSGRGVSATERYLAKLPKTELNAQLINESLAYLDPFEGGYNYCLKSHYGEEYWPNNLTIDNVRSLDKVKEMFGMFYDFFNDVDGLADFYENVWRDGTLNLSRSEFVAEALRRNMFTVVVNLDFFSRDSITLRINLQSGTPAAPASISPVIVVPPSPLGMASFRKLSSDTITFYLHPDLITVTVNTEAKSMFIDYFFYKATDESRNRARKIAKAAGRTLGGLGMEWVKAVADSQGVTVIELTDSWTGADGLKSRDLMDAAKMARLVNNVNRRADRAKPKNNNDPNFRTKFLQRIQRGGYYGQWGFVDNRVETNDMVDINTAFVDMCN